MAKETNQKTSSKKKDYKTTTKKVDSQNIKKKETTKSNNKKDSTLKPLEKKQTKQKKTDSNRELSKITVENRKVHTVNTKKKNTDEVTKLVEIILVVLVIFAAFYLITYWVQNSKKKNTTNNEMETSTENSVIQYDEILIGNLFDQSNSEYYVLVMSQKDKEDKTFTDIMSAYKEKENSIRVYTANLDSAFNASYKADVEKLDTDNIAEIKFKGNTLVKISDHKIVSVTEDTTNIKSKLSE